MNIVGNCRPISSVAKTVAAIASPTKMNGNVVDTSKEFVCSLKTDVSMGGREKNAPDAMHVTWHGGSIDGDHASLCSFVSSDSGSVGSFDIDIDLDKVENFHSPPKGPTESSVGAQTLSQTQHQSDNLAIDHDSGSDSGSDTDTGTDTESDNDDIYNENGSESSSSISDSSRDEDRDNQGYGIKGGGDEEYDDDIISCAFAPADQSFRLMSMHQQTSHIDAGSADLRHSLGGSFRSTSRRRIQPALVGTDKFQAEVQQRPSLANAAPHFRSNSAIPCQVPRRPPSLVLEKSQSMINCSNQHRVPECPSEEPSRSSTTRQKEGQVLLPAQPDLILNQQSQHPRSLHQHKLPHDYAPKFQVTRRSSIDLCFEGRTESSPVGVADFQFTLQPPNGKKENTGSGRRHFIDSGYYAAGNGNGSHGQGANCNGSQDHNERDDSTVSEITEFTGWNSLSSSMSWNFSPRDLEADQDVPPQKPATKSTLPLPYDSMDESDSSEELYRDGPSRSNSDYMNKSMCSQMSSALNDTGIFVAPPQMPRRSWEDSFVTEKLMMCDFVRTTSQVSQTKSILSTTSSNNRRQSGPPRSVKFEYIEVRNYERVLEINPSTSSGPSIGLGWNYEPAEIFAMDEYEPELCREELYESSRYPMSTRILSRRTREGMLYDLGYTRRQIARAIRRSLKVKNQRKQTYNNLSAQRMEEMMEKSRRKVKKILRFRSKKKSRRKRDSNDTDASISTNSDLMRAGGSLASESSSTSSDS